MKSTWSMFWSLCPSYSPWRVACSIWPGSIGPCASRAMRHANGPCQGPFPPELPTTTATTTATTTDPLRWTALSFGKPSFMWQVSQSPGPFGLFPYFDSKQPAMSTSYLLPRWYRFKGHSTLLYTCGLVGVNGYYRINGCGRLLVPRNLPNPIVFPRNLQNRSAGTWNLLTKSRKGVKTNTEERKWKQQKQRTLETHHPSKLWRKRKRRRLVKRISKLKVQPPKTLQVSQRRKRLRRKKHCYRRSPAPLVAR
mmetsp:Transcript_7708/g.21468  ORF Transcript_7708/g.21468 Transcript_7708/m.21468 type:complete len:252 (-) Transcript_7708:333-1088(-)